MKLISVIVPVYNTEKYIEKCVMSILNQTYKNLEIILIDDGSTDNSPQICDSLAEKDNRIAVIHQPNGGVSSARNIGLDNTHGDYITFVDSDDYIAPNMIEFLSENIGDTNIAMCGYTSVDENGNLSPQENVTVTDGIISTDTFWNYFYTDTRIYYVTLWAKLYKSHLWNTVRFPLNTLHEDEFAVHQIISQCSKIAVSKKPLYFYLQREGSIMHTQFKTENLNAAEGILDRCQFFFNKKEYTLAEKALSMAMYSIIKGYGILGENDKIKELYKQFRLMYRKLVFKNTSMKFKYKCGIFALNKQIFIKLKK